MSGRSGTDAGRPAAAGRLRHPLILFGAFDRHNLGDLLLARVAGRLCSPRVSIAAGLRGRDQTASGGVVAVAMSTLDAAADVLHVGGELLCCDAFDAAVMLQRPFDAARIVARLDRNRGAAERWASRQLGSSRHLPYLFPPGAGLRLYAGIGGSALDRLPAPARAEAIDAMRAADGLWLREARTRQLLASAGVAAPLAPDPVTLVAALFGRRIVRRAAAGDLTALRRRFGRGYLALQLRGDWGDDATIDAVAEQLGRASTTTGYGVVLFCAGRAPWHDDPALYHRLLRRRPLDAIVFDATDIWALCALIASSVATIATSLHARIVAEAFARPVLSLSRGSDGTAKLEAYVDTWADDRMRGLAAPEQLADALPEVLASSPRLRADHAAAQAYATRSAWQALLRRLR
ncbi:MAG: polysaccharide pyruvyl transferase family protein [Zoogloeaceae bacterium]|nr:polysaccharide pyruvyl transferase family protein [Rhodocyclaceae bacterium]MCP5238194.1 polysaccharide pyruvyl transferase family protein [Zoogloeaceae bacterium]